MILLKLHKAGKTDMMTDCYLLVFFLAISQL